jgi:D-sedoheptulose 7-phosphate isomerase
MTFPNDKYAGPGDYFSAYAAELSRAASAIDTAAFDGAADLLRAAIAGRKTIFSCGNGGSCAISNHLLCDFAKGIQTDTEFLPSVISLSASTELITAIANDIHYDEIFAYQLRTLARPGDVLITISSSGDSENIVRAIDWARTHELHTVAFTGFRGGRSSKLADVNVHVPSDNYGVIEDLHQSTMHVLAQALRMEGMSNEKIAAVKF